MNRNLFSALKLEKTMMFLLLVLITIVASFNIVSTLTMIVTEKQKEIAILKAMGATKRSIRRIFMLNGLIIGFAGTGHRHSLGLHVSLADSDILDVRSDGVLHLHHSCSCAGRGRVPRGRVRHSDQLFWRRSIRPIRPQSWNQSLRCAMNRFAGLRIEGRGLNRITFKCRVTD